MLPDGREAKDVLPAKADTGVDRDRREKREAAGWEVWGNEAVDLVPGRHESIVRAMTPAKVEELWSSSSAIRLSPSQIRACGFPAPGSSRG
jgi:hypothetical protein